MLRGLGFGALALLLLNASCPASATAGRPLVLLDGSLSMGAAGGRWPEARALAAELGEVRLAGALPGDTLPTGGRSRFSDQLRALRAGGRPVILVTDGEVDDAAELRADSLGAGIRVLSRRAVPGIALTRIEGTARVTPSDTLELRLEATRFGGSEPRAVLVEAGAAGRVWLRGRMILDAGGRGTATLRGPVPPVGAGAHVLRVALTDAGDPEPRDDARLFLVTIVPTPGIVLVARPPTWESRFLVEAVRDIADLPVRGFLEVERGVWRRYGTLDIVPSNEVTEAVRRADLLILLGSATPPLATRARGRWEWRGAAGGPGSGSDWYLRVPSGTPLSDAFAGLAVDSFPPGTAVAELAPGSGDWVGLTAQAERRGTVRPVLLGRDSARVRRIVSGVDGLWRWAFRGGSSEQGYRALVSAAVSWLLGGADSSRGLARPVREVVQRSRPVAFQWTGEGPPRLLAIEWTGDTATRRDTLRFDGSGRAEQILPPGIWRYRLDGSGAGTIAVEEYSDEWIPSRPVLQDRAVSAAAPADRRPLRGMVWLFGVAVVAFAGEWYARRRRGMR